MVVRKFKQVSDRTFGSHIEHNNHYHIIYKEMTLMYSSKNDDNDSRDKTTTSRVGYSRNNSSDDDNLHTAHYKQGKQQTDVAPGGDERQERMRAEKRIHDLEDDVKELEAVNKRRKELTATATCSQ